jgi:hypothetical protein
MWAGEEQSAPQERGNFLTKQVRDKSRAHLWRWAGITETRCYERQQSV